MSARMDRLSRRVEILSERKATIIDPRVRAEVEAALAAADAEYNSPEAEAERRRRYEELREIGEKRRAAFYAGQDMDEVAPLPAWMTDKPDDADRLFDELFNKQPDDRQKG